jgi:hypothetical protein
MIESAIARPQDVPREILTELAINPSAGRFEGLLDTSIGEKLASALLAEKPVAQIQDTWCWSLVAWDFANRELC